MKGQKSKGVGSKIAIKTTSKRRQTPPVAASQQRPKSFQENTERSPALTQGIVEPLSVLVRWSRLRFYERIADEVGVAIDRSAITIIDMLHRYGPIRLSDLARRIGLDRSTVSRQVAAVVHHGFVEKVDDAKDARAALLSLSPLGQELREKVAQAWGGIALGLVADWSVEDRTEFARLLGILAERLQADSGI